MLLDVKSLSGGEHFQTKFLRVGNEIYIIGENEDFTYHIELARKEKILERIGYLKEQNSAEVDGGMMFINNRSIRIGSHSTTLSVPKTSEAREITTQLLRKQLPDYSVKEVNEVS